MSFPPATEMFQFAGFASRNLFYSVPRYLFPITLTTIARSQDNRIRWVSPFGNRRVKACSQLTDAYRSVPRPSSPVHAKASTNCPYLTLESPHHQQQHWISPKTDTKLGRAVLSGLLGEPVEVILRWDPLGVDNDTQPVVGARSERSNSIATPCSGTSHSPCGVQPNTVTASI
jgi:hypothetical protein